ncbi:hypothetical protein SMC26_44790 [Actinomadura fulvescens]|uniref:hypothetical protein n=1 Tax=Actinomadura fulvescens TaxID=46160 RepID=UPI0031E24982
MSAAVLGFGAGQLFGTSTATAQPVAATVAYTCQFHDGSALPMASKSSSALPRSVFADEPMPEMGLYTVFSFGRTLDTKITSFSYPKKTGTIQVNSTRKVPLSGANNVGLQIFAKSAETMPPLDLGEPYEFQDHGALPKGFHYANAGTNTFSLGNVILRLTVKDDAGTVISQAPNGDAYYTVNCTPNSGQTLTLGTFTSKPRAARR